MRGGRAVFEVFEAKFSGYRVSIRAVNDLSVKLYNHG